MCIGQADFENDCNSEGKRDRDILSICLGALKMLFFAIEIVDFGKGGTRAAPRGCLCMPIKNSVLLHCLCRPWPETNVVIGRELSEHGAVNLPLATDVEESEAVTYGCLLLDSSGPRVCLRFVCNYGVPLSGRARKKVCGLVSAGIAPQGCAIRKARFFG